MSFLVFLKFVRSTITIILIIIFIGYAYKFVHFKISTSQWAISKQAKLVARREKFQQISNPASNSTTMEEFMEIFQIEQEHLKSIYLANILVNRTILIQSLKYCKKLQTLRLINITFIEADFEERVHLPNLRQYEIQIKTTTAGSLDYYIEDDVQLMKKYRNWEQFKTLIPFTTMGYQQAKSVGKSKAEELSFNKVTSSSNKSLPNSTTGLKIKDEYSIDDFNWLVVSSQTDLNVRIGNVKLFLVIHNQGLLLSYLTFNQQLLFQIQQPNQFELKHLYLLDDSSSISTDTLPNNLITLFSYKLFEPRRKNQYDSWSPGFHLSKKSHFEMKIEEMRKIQELRLFLHPNVKWFDLHSINPLVRHLAISNAILTNHFGVTFLFLQNLALDVYLIDDETIVDQLSLIFPNCKKVVLDFSSINSEVHERKILSEMLKLPNVEWIVVRFYQIRRFKIWTENVEIESFLDKLGIGEDSDCFLITRNLTAAGVGGREWKGIDLNFDQVRELTGQLSADADDFIISQVGLQN